MLKRLLAQSLCALAGALFAFSPAAAQETPLNYDPNDLMMGFRATGGDGSGLCYLVNLGPASNFVNATQPFTVQNLGNIKADLDATFPGWQNDASVFWSVSAANASANPPGSPPLVGGEPRITMFASRKQLNPPNTNPTRWNRNSGPGQASPAGKMLDMGKFYEFVNGDDTAQVRRVSSANSPKGTVRSNTEPNCYSVYQPGGSQGSVSGSPASFAYFGNPTLESTFAGGTSGAVLELIRLRPAVIADIGTPGDFIGTFQLDNNAVLTFTPTPSAQVQFSNAAFQGNEDGGVITVTLTRSGDLSGGFTVNFSTTDGGATSPADFTAQTNTPVSFAASQTTQTVDVLVNNRAGFQGNRSLTVSLSEATNGAKILAPSTATVRILEVDPGVQFDSATYSVSETGTNAEVKLVRIGAPTAFTVTLNTSDIVGEAVAGTDYTAQVNVAVPFLVTDAEKTVTIPVANRTGIQGDRDFTATISNPTSGVALGTPVAAVVTIEDVVNAGTVVFNPIAYTQAEPGSGVATVTVTATRTGGSDGDASVDVVVDNASTAQASDYTLTTPVVLEWNEGESGAKTFNVGINHDNVSEATAETIVLKLQNATGVAIGAQSTATITLPAEDSVGPTLTVTEPKNNAKITSDFVTFKGTAADAVGVARVRVSINGGAIVEETINQPPTTTLNWTVSVAPEQGANEAVVTAFDAAGNASTPITIMLTFTNKRVNLAGKYNGLLVSTVAATDPYLRNGLVTVTVGPTGTFTGKVTLAGAALPIQGIFLTGDDTSAEARFGEKNRTATVELVKKVKSVTTQLGTLALAISTNGGLKVTGTLKNGANTLANISTDLAVYTKKPAQAPFKNVPTSLLNPAREKGKYTGALLPAAIAAGQPAGNGYGALSISTSGVVKFVGKTADGQKISYSNALSTDNRWPVFVQLYSKQGFIAGEVKFDDTQAATDAAGDLTWFKPENLAGQTLYPAGWKDGIGSNFIASKYLVPKAATASVPNPPNPGTILGPGVPGATSGAANIEVELNDGGLANDTSNDASIDAKSKVTVLGATAGGPGAATGLKVTFTTKTGAMSGSFTHPGQPKALKFGGMVFQKTGEAYGSFLFLPKTGTQAAGGVFVEEK